MLFNKELNGYSHSLHCGNSGCPIACDSQVWKEYDISAFQYIEIFFTEQPFFPPEAIHKNVADKSW